MTVRQAISDGRSLCRELRSRERKLPIIVLTARDAPELVVFWFTLAVSVAGLGMSLVQGRMLTGLPGGLGALEATWKIALLAGLGLGGQLLMTRAYGRAAAPVVAIVAYASIPLSASLDHLAWGVVPGLDGVLGATAMVVAGVLLVRSRDPATIADDARLP